MRTIKFIALLFALASLIVSCEKDERGQTLTYYKHVTAEGYVFYKYLDGSIEPFANQEVEITAEDSPDPGGMGGGLYIHTIQKVKTDANGNYYSRFVKTVDSWEIACWVFCPIGMTDHSTWFLPNSRGIKKEAVQHAANKATKKNPQIVPIDTLWIKQKH
jgi:hypothetical protein